MEASFDFENGGRIFADGLISSSVGYDGPTNRESRPGRGRRSGDDQAANFHGRSRESLYSSARQALSKKVTMMEPHLPIFLSSLHQTNTPAITTIDGNRNWLMARTQLIVRGQGDAAVFLLFGPDRDQVFVGREPVDRIQRQVAVSVEIEETVRQPGELPTTTKRPWEFGLPVL